jgi:hypothetical protein
VGTCSIVRRTVVAAGLFGTLVLSGSHWAWAARSEMTSPGRSIDPDPRERTSGIDEAPWKQSVVPHLALYLNLMESVGAEDDRIQKEMRQSAAQPEKRTDYGQEIGINKDEEELVLAILLEAYHQREDLQKQKDAAVNEGGLAAGRDDLAGVAAAQAREAELIRARSRVLNDMWAALKANLGDESLRKLDAYVNREFSEEPALSVVH